MLQSLIVGLLLAAVSAVCFVAFKHPNGYAKLFPYLIGITTAVFVATSVWQAAVEMTWSGVSGFLESDARAAASSAKKALSLPYVCVVFTYVAVAAFLWINLKLPPFLQHTDQNAAPDNNGSR